MNRRVQYHFTLSPRYAQQLIWSRTINTHGLPGRNIPCDLHMEHLNRLAKEAIKGLGANTSEKAICGQYLGMISPVLDQYDKECCVTNVSGAHKSASGKKTLLLYFPSYRKQMF